MNKHISAFFSVNKTYEGIDLFATCHEGVQTRMELVEKCEMSNS
jgi:hypothetical protein